MIENFRNRNTKAKNSLQDDEFGKYLIQICKKYRLDNCKQIIKSKLNLGDYT